MNIIFINIHRASTVNRHQIWIYEINALRELNALIYCLIYFQDIHYASGLCHTEAKTDVLA